MNERRNEAMGGKPNPGTPKDKRLKENKPAQQKPAQPPKKGGK